MKYITSSIAQSFNDELTLAVNVKSNILFITNPLGAPFEMGMSLGLLWLHDNTAFLDWSPQFWIFSFDEDIPDHSICSWIDFFH